MQSVYISAMSDGIGLLILLLPFFLRPMQEKNARLLKGLMLTNALALLLELTLTVCPSSCAWLSVLVSFMLQPAFCYLWLLRAYALSRGEITRRVAIWSAIPLLIELAIVAACILTARIDLLTVRVTSSAGFCWIQSIAYPYLLCAFFLTNRDAASPHTLLHVLCYSLLVCGIASQFLIGRGLFTIWAIALVFSVQRQARLEQAVREQQQTAALHQLQAQLEESKRNLLAGQVKPHFLYNSLNIISFLCGDETNPSRQAIDHLAGFLRGNMDSLAAQKLIPFEDELANVKHFLYIECLRFGKRLHVEYDLQTVAFSLPVMTLQPLVENAIRHGVMPKPEGGTVWIRTSAQDGAVLLCIQDDGVGFDLDAPCDEGRTHVGIANTRARVQAMCSGSLEVVSQPGQGACVTVRIPRP